MQLVQTIKAAFPRGTRLAILGTIQFAPALHALKAELSEWLPDVVIPQAKPLSPGEVLGCTSPNLTSLGVEAYVFVADGRFHLEVRRGCWRPHARSRPASGPAPQSCSLSSAALVPADSVCRASWLPTRACKPTGTTRTASG